MTDEAPPSEEVPSSGSGAGGGGASGPGSGSGSGGVEVEARKPRKIFLLVGLVIAVILGIFLFTGLGTSNGSGTSGSGVGTGSGTGSAPSVGDRVPSFTARNLGSAGGSSVSVSARPGGKPTVLLFFGEWCPSCHQELPPLAAALRDQASPQSGLSGIRVVGVDSLDKVDRAKAFIQASGVKFPVAYDPNANITSGLFYFTGDPYAVFVRADGTIGKIVRGDVLTPASLSADERALIPSGT